MHRRDKHKSFTCSLDGMEFASEYFYKKHRNESHTHQEQELCPRCPAIFAKKTDRLKHQLESVD